MGRKGGNRRKPADTGRPTRKDPKGKDQESRRADRKPFAASALNLEVDEEIDLHGFAIDEAMVLVEQALGRWGNHPGACIRIIHGKSAGNHDSIKGKLRYNLETVWKKRVKSFRQEFANTGASLVFLA